MELMGIDVLKMVARRYRNPAIVCPPSTAGSLTDPRSHCIY